MENWRKNRLLYCRECDWQGLESYRLVAANPFNREEKIYGCPNCGAVDQFEYLCDLPECGRPCSSGEPSEIGYLHLCLKHGVSDIMQYLEARGGETLAK